MSRLRHVITARVFLDRDLLASLFASAGRMELDDVGRTLPQPMRGRILASLFYEPSTRTRFSFEAAMQKLGGGVITAENARDSSSAVKGETISDTVKVIAGYADAIVMRHFAEGAAAAAAAISPVPVINAGDGAGEHPTQALGDIYTMQRELGGIDGLRIALVGDLRYGRTIHSLLPLLCVHRGVMLDLISPPQLRLPEAYLNLLRDHGIQFRETADFERALQAADVAYITRVQRERFATEADYAAVQDVFILSAALADTLKPHAIIMHALPRVHEISPEVDANHRAAYFRQTKNALYCRMALLNDLLA